MQTVFKDSMLIARCGDMYNIVGTNIPALIAKAHILAKEPGIQEIDIIVPKALRKYYAEKINKMSARLKGKNVEFIAYYPDISFTFRSEKEFFMVVTDDAEQFHDKVHYLVVFHETQKPLLASLAQTKAKQIIILPFSEKRRLSA